MNNRPGFSLVELIISIGLISIVMYAAIAIYITSGSRGVDMEKFSVGQSLAEGKLEQVMARPFAAITNEASTAFTGDFAGFSSEVVVNYVSGEALNTIVASSEYKKISVRVRNYKLSGLVSLESIRANY